MKKKPSAADASAKTQGKATVVKKPAAASHVPMSKIDMTDIFNELRESFGTISRGAFVTKAYKRAENRMQKQGFPKARCIEFAKENHSKAVMLWNQLSEP